MATDAQVAANLHNAKSSTGPRTAEGKSHSSRNAVTHGLYSVCDYVLPAEQTEYQALSTGFRNELTPCGPIEETLVAEIIHAAWRLRRCSKAEESLLVPDTGSGAADPIATAAQASIDRARSSAGNALHRSLAGLRKIQTDRRICAEILGEDDAGPETGLIDFRQVVTALNAHDKGKLLASRADIEKALAVPTPPPRPAPAPDLEAALALLGSFCNPAKPSRPVARTGHSEQRPLPHATEIAFARGNHELNK